MAAAVNPERSLSHLSLKDGQTNRVPASFAHCERGCMLTDSQSIRVPRHDLYEKVWSQPITKLAHEYGISDVALAKICRKLDIPYPGRGYWRREQTGKVVKQLPLPASSDPAKQSATISKRSQPQPVDHLSVQTKD